MTENNSQPTPDPQAATPAAVVTNVAPNSQVIAIPPPEVTPVPVPVQPAVNPALESVQTQKAIEFFKANPDVLEHVVRQVSTGLPDFNPAPEQFVSRKQYTLDRAVAQYGLSAEDAALLATADVSTIPALAARLAAANTIVNPTQTVTPTAARLPKPAAAASGKKPPPDVGTGEGLSEAFQAFRGNFGRG